MAAVILAGDVGGTKTHLGLYRVQGTTFELIREHIYETRRFQSLAAVCLDFLSLGREGVQAMCFGVPGPVIGSEARPTNLPWTIGAAELSRALGGVPVRLMNDLAAMAYGVIHLGESEFEVLQRGRFPLHQANVAVIAAGTGLGEASLVFERGDYHPVASEGGHADFAPRTEEQFQLWKFLAAEFGHVSVERVVSGPGIFNIYRFLRSRSPNPSPAWLAERLRNQDPGAVISEAALSGADPECVHALEMFADIYGAEAGNLALKVLALGGVYVGGGIAPKILPVLKEGFRRGFNDKGRLQEMLSGIEIRVSLNQSAGLLGAAHYATAML